MACDGDVLTSDSVQSHSSSAALSLLPEVIDHRPYAELTNAGDVRLQPTAVYRHHIRHGAYCRTHTTRTPRPFLGVLVVQEPTWALGTGVRKLKNVKGRFSV